MRAAMRAASAAVRDLKNAGARWVDEQVVVDGNMVSSRRPDDIPAFNDAMITLFSSAMRHAAHSE
ncbi:MAG TPA: DJ-1/PfpI family protein [Gemmatimonadaceae bacterium]|nr:DJ-1/PfpI family protein [Gemmatimonadaceae bacterium]